MEFSIQQIAALIGGKIEGDGNKIVSSFSKIEEAETGNLAFLANPKYEEFLYTTKASAVIISEDLALKQAFDTTFIRVKDPYASFAFLMQYYQQIAAEKMVGIQEPVYIDKSAKIGENVFIGAFAFIGENAIIEDGAKIYPQVYIGKNVCIGKKSVINPGTKIYHDCAIGNEVIIHAGAIIGSDGFGFAPQVDGSYQKVPQMGNVVIEDNVEIGANTCIDRATMGSTIIRKGTKLDNLLQIAHNVEIGEDSVIAAQTGISGSTKIGKRAMIGGQVGIIGHITIAEGVKVGAQSGINNNVTEKNKALNGTPAFDHLSSLKSLSIFRKLPALSKKVEELEALIKKLATGKNID
jgi:UDP-3-O-[3-hydroxymyristoyl] glucosamine N-acyltransferase